MLAFEEPSLLPPGCHLALTLPTARDWRGFVAAVKQCVARMRADPSLNHNASTASYGLAATIGQFDVGFIEEMCKVHSAALLDALGD